MAMFRMAPHTRIRGVSQIVQRMEGVGRPLMAGTLAVHFGGVGPSQVHGLG